MEKIERILVGLELRESDFYLIKYAHEIAKIIQPTTIDFLHITESLDPAVLKHGNFTPRDEKLEQMMQEEVSMYFKGSEFQTRFDVIEGRPVEQLLHWAVVKQSDLIILGRKEDATHAEVTVEKIIRKSPCSVLLVPDKAKPQFDKFLTAIDFSSKSVDIIELLNDVFDFPQIDGIHFFDLPTGYYKTGKTEEEFIKILDFNAKETATKMVTKLPKNDNLSFTNICSEGMDEYDHIVNHAKKNNYNMIVIGSRGKTDAAAVLLGSFAEKFIRHNREIPTFIVKTKGENMGFLEAFLQL